MTVAICALVPDGIILGADSRQVRMSSQGLLRIDSDHVQKILPISSRTAAIICGQGYFYEDASKSPQGILTLVKSISKQLPSDLSIIEYAKSLHDDLSRIIGKHHKTTGEEGGFVTFYLGGYNLDQTIGELYRCHIPGEVCLERTTTDAGIVWHGQDDIIRRIILGYDPRLFDLLNITDEELGKVLDQINKIHLFINFQTLPLEDAKNLVIDLIQSTITLKNLSDGIVGQPGDFPVCGGAVEVALIRPLEGFCWLQHQGI